MKTLLIIPFLFVMTNEPDSTRVQRPVKLFFEDTSKRMENINSKLDSILIRLDSLKIEDYEI